MFSVLYEYQHFYRTGLYIWVTRRVSNKKQKPLTLRELRVVMSVAMSEQKDVLFVFTSSCSCLIYIVCFCLRRVVSNTYCVVFFFRFSWFWVRYIASCAGLSIFCSLYCSRLLLLKTKRDDFNYVIMHLSHLNSNISTAFAYAVKILR
jgi:hypothetical protein